ncbi:hypothetical protein Thiowin_03038 [Thiorhodovibrio winogradskyi]|uniref:Uncharacterized protein n=1 Tax=Thiorhodovibrio winogradskyi TaxID=77007 RepID=A0ABZ0SAD8_9GAMM|nr:hypothetical protein [Thiorhodovibrio winogradskyi]
MARHIETLIGGQSELFSELAELDARWKPMAQQLAAQVIRARAVTCPSNASAPNFQSVDVETVDVVRPRSVAVEHVALAAWRQIGLEDKLAPLGFSGPQRAAAIGNVIGRMVAPGSELATHQWLQQRSALGKLIDVDFADLDLMALYLITDRLLAHKPAFWSTSGMARRTDGAVEIERGTLDGTVVKP